MNRFASMGCEIVCAGVDVEVVRAIFERFDATFSRFRPESELNRVNARAGSAVRVSPLFARTLRLALDLAEETDGVLDPTLGGALEAAGYDSDFGMLEEDDRPPAPASSGCFRELRLQDRFLLVPRGVRLDLNGVVKALAVDEAAGAIDGEGFVSAGGDLAVRGALDVALPADGAVRVLAGGLATSGSTKRRWLRGGTEQHHLIDARTGLPSRPCWTEVTVSGATCVDADAAAKVAFLLGDDGPTWLDARGLPGRFVRADGTVLESRTWAGTAAACI